MNPRPAVCEKGDTKKAESSFDAVERVVDRLSAIGAPKSAPDFGNRNPLEKALGGQVLAAHNGGELAVAGARVELYSVSPLRSVVRDMPKSVLVHLRALLLEKALPIDLYQCGGHVADAPIIDFADVLRLHEVPGYELLVAAAKSQPDASFKQMLCNNPAVLQPLLCYYHPGSFSAACVASTISDAAGFFQFSVPKFDSADEQPGYCFIVRRPISSSFYITLYSPTPAAWHTHWNWSTGKTVTLRTRHPLALRAHTQI